MGADPESPSGAAPAYVPPSQAVCFTVAGPKHGLPKAQCSEEPRSPLGPSVAPTYLSPVVLKAPQSVFEKSQYALSEASTASEDFVYDRPTPSDGARTPMRVSSKMSRASSVVSFVGVDDEDDDADASQKETWHGREGNRARMRHRFRVVGAARSERWKKWRTSFGNAIGLKWAQEAA